MGCSEFCWLSSPAGLDTRGLREGVRQEGASLLKGTPLLNPREGPTGHNRIKLTMKRRKGGRGDEGGQQEGISDKQEPAAVLEGISSAGRQRPTVNQSTRRAGGRGDAGGAVIISSHTTASGRPIVVAHVGGEGERHR